MERDGAAAEYVAGASELAPTPPAQRTNHRLHRVYDTAHTPILQGDTRQQDTDADRPTVHHSDQLLVLGQYFKIGGG